MREKKNKKKKKKIHRWKEGGGGGGNERHTDTAPSKKNQNTPKTKKGSGINQLE